MPGEVSVELTLLLEKAKQQIRSFAPAMGIELAKATSNIASGTDKAASAMDKYDGKIKKATNSLNAHQKAVQAIMQKVSGQTANVIDSSIVDKMVRDQKGRFKKRSPYLPGEFAGGGTEGTAQVSASAFFKKEEEASSRARIARANRNRMLDYLDEQKAKQAAFAAKFQASPLTNMLKRQTMLTPGLPTNQFPALPNATPAPATGLAGLLGGKSINSTLIRSLIGSVAGSSLAGPIGSGLGAAAMGASGPLAIGLAAVTLALKGMRLAVQQTAEAFDRARKMYASILQGGGMAQRFVITQNVLAQVIGVSERDVYQYGRAIEFVNAQLEVAIRALNDTQRTLAATSMNQKVMSETFHAVWAKVAAALAEPMNRLYALITALEKLYIVSGAASLIGEVIGGIVDLFTRILAFTEIIPAAMLTMATAIVDTIKWMMAEIHNIIANSWVGKQIGMKPEAVPGFQNTKDAAAAFKEVLKTLLSIPGTYAAQTPKTPVSIERMPSSAWERMGLIIGQTGGMNPAKTTATNTTKLVALTEKLIQCITTKSRPSMDHVNPTASYA